MNEERLYYTDSYLVEFDAVVRDAVRKEDQWEVTLDRTAFYPTSGGQPYDVGTLDEAKVLDVFDQEDGTVGHLVDRELEKNCRVRGHVDWNRGRGDALGRSPRRSRWTDPPGDKPCDGARS